jgi:hypothetical protein
MTWNEESDISLDRIAVALELIAKSLDKIANPMVQVNSDPAPMVYQCVPQVHLSKCTHTVYACAVKVDEKQESSSMDKDDQEG